MLILLSHSARTTLPQRQPDLSMDDMPICDEQKAEQLPSVASAYQLYNDDELQEFIEQADFLLDEMELTRYHKIQLLIWAPNCVEDIADTRE